jgi:glutamyl-tRNA synthetase
MARTALFSWAYARHHGGTFVFRIEDTDAARDSEDSYKLLIDVMRWLRLDWDEGPEVGGPHGPYRQSQRLDVYADVAAKLMGTGAAYRCYCTTAEVDERRRAADADAGPTGYDNHCRELSGEQVAGFEAEGRAPVLRMRMPEHAITFTDLVRGEITFSAEHVPDYVLVRANGQPLYTLVNPVDDALMGITHVLRGEDLLSSTPRQIALYEAFATIGVGDGTIPEFGHLPYVMGSGNKKLSKRDPESNLLAYRDQGFLPEGLLNYLALLGWAIAEDRDVFGLDEMVEAFEINRVNPNPARFDIKKCEAINGSHMRLLEPTDAAARQLRYLQQEGLVADVPTDAERALVAAAMPLVQERVSTFVEGARMLSFLFVAEEQFHIDPAERAKTLDGAGAEVVRAAVEVLEDVDSWATSAIETALRERLVEQLGLKPRHAFGPVRVAVTGARVSPPLFESMELLGRERSLMRLRAALD